MRYRILLEVDQPDANALSVAGMLGHARPLPRIDVLRIEPVVEEEEPFNFDTYLDELGKTDPATGLTVLEGTHAADDILSRYDHWSDAELRVLQALADTEKGEGKGVGMTELGRLVGGDGKKVGQTMSSLTRKIKALGYVPPFHKLADGSWLMGPDTAYCLSASSWLWETLFNREEDAKAAKRKTARAAKAATKV